MTQIKFIDELPPDARRNKKRGWGADIAPQLKEQPGRWAEVQSWQPSSVCPAASRAQQVLKGKSSFGPAGAFEAIAYKHPDGRWSLYVRYVGEAGGQS